MKKLRDLVNLHGKKKPNKNQREKTPAASSISCQSHNCAKLEIPCSAELSTLV